MWQCQPDNWFCFPVPPCPPVPLPPPGALNGPIRGVINGVPAMVGMVGEFNQKSLTGNLTVAAGASLVTTVVPLTLGAGDWDIEAMLNISELFTSASFILNPTIQGASSNMFSARKLPGVAAMLTTETFVSQRTQLLTAVAAVPLQFDITTNNSGAASATGAYTFTVNVRRMR